MKIERNIAATGAGYASAAYARSLSGFGAPIELPRAGGWLLKRPIAGSTLCDAMGPYPLFACREWSALADDLEALNDVVSISLVADPFGTYDEQMLRRAFERVTRFKPQVVYDLDAPREAAVSSGHRNKARRATRQLDVHFSETPLDHLDDWMRLYDTLIDRHELQGIKAFSEDAFAKQLALPEMTMVRAMSGDTCIASVLWLRHGDVVYYHLGASDEQGYAIRASYALFWQSIEHFAPSAAWLCLGAGAGTGAGDGGLSQFKKGWSEAVRWSYFCGRVCRRNDYDDLTAATDNVDTSFFPAYRVGVFA